LIEPPVKPPGPRTAFGATGEKRGDCDSWEPRSSTIEPLGDFSCRAEAARSEI